jgi:hypothetical protein
MSTENLKIDEDVLVAFDWNEYIIREHISNEEALFAAAVSHQVKVALGYKYDVDPIGVNHCSFRGKDGKAFVIHPMIMIGLPGTSYDLGVYFQEGSAKVAETWHNNDETEPEHITGIVKLSVPIADPNSIDKVSD